MERLVKDTTVYMKIEDQLVAYKEKRGLFRYRGSLSTYLTRPPVIWWGEYGDDAPELKSFAIKVLGLTCSASACERNWSTFNQVHTKRRNRLNTERMNNLVYIMYNKKLKQNFIKRTKLKEDDPLVVDHVLSDDEWIAAPSDGEEDDIGGGGILGEEDGGVIGSARAGRAIGRPRGGGTIGEGSGTRKRKNVQVNLIDEDNGDEVNLIDDDEGDRFENDADYFI
ncbi:unnamed protein product [Lactuca saligna]|uniref:HAT C-terminal dimerisation domain-containing protein n=1 Tax=Lactuca saligna TaxID=75948 RepID=A0AA35ZGN6_LACSI|nr:unnamed protein product [Lactuca saligna]